MSLPEQRVSFGTSGHRGSSLSVHVQRGPHRRHQPGDLRVPRAQGIDGPLFLGADTHALSEPATVSALEVFVANDVTVLVDSRDGYTPTPSLSRAILAHNASGPAHRADGVVVTPSHNPPPDGGFKYNPPDGGPAGTEITTWIQDRANALLADGLTDVRRVPYARARAVAARRTTSSTRTSRALPQVVDLDAIRAAGVRIGADPLGGRGVDYWGEIGDTLRPRPDRRESGGRPDVPVHDARLGRQDPDGLLVAVRDGLAHRARRTTSTSRPATTPTPTGTASSRPTAG